MVETIIVAETIVTSIIRRIDINQFHAITETLAERIKRKQVVTFDDEVIVRTQFGCFVLAFAVITAEMA